MIGLALSEIRQRPETGPNPRSPDCTTRQHFQRIESMQGIAPVLAASKVLAGFWPF